MTVNAIKNCTICGGDGVEYEQVDDKREKRPCPCLTRLEKQTQSESETLIWDYSPKKPTAKDLAEEGMARVLSNVKGDEEEKALKAIYEELLMLIRLQPLAFSADDLAERCKEKKLYEKLHSTNLIGTLFKRAKTDKLIVSTGVYQRSQQPQSHGRPLMIWRKR